MIAIIRFDSNNKVAFMNDVAERYFGYTQKEARRLKVTDLMPEEYRQEFLKILNTHSHKDIEKYETGIFKTYGLHKDGTSFKIVLVVDIDRKLLKPWKKEYFITAYVRLA